MDHGRGEELASDCTPAVAICDDSEFKHWRQIIIEFDRMVRLIDKPSPPVRMQPAGSKRSQWGYPSATEHDGKLYVVYSITKEATGLSIVEMSKVK